MVVHHQRVYVLHDTGLIVYCYTPDGSLSHEYEHEDGSDGEVYGMCLIMSTDTSMLVVCSMYKTLVWIRIDDDGTIDDHWTQQIQYPPCGPNNDKGDLLVCDFVNQQDSPLHT